ncbi:DNA alkylation repair protein [Negadavirga shengliensis]|uniref:DNA alkylation repair protein n=1 Tax=Negadavirga shengliensis TaxID=1389218 RepID=A0ABV9T6G7_9BACT
MTTKQILAELKALGSEKMKAHNIRHGASESNQFGVKMGDIRKVAKKIKTADKDLALTLWDTQIIEAQLLAVLLMKPSELSIEELEKLVKTTSFDYVADWFNTYISNKHPEKEQLRQMWITSDNKWALRSAWSILASKITKDAADLDLGKLLDQIEKEMPMAQPEVQWTMNFALAHIGIYHPAHRQRAIDLGNKLGIYKDYPVSKGCTSPFAPIWINEMVKRQTD